MLLASPSFSDFLERLSTNPAQLPQPEQQQAPRQQGPKDVNPYAAQQQIQRQHIGVAMMPEQHMDFSMVGGVDAEAYNFQPQVYAVLETPEPPVNIDTAALSGKASNFVGQSLESEDEKAEMPVIEQAPVVEEKATAPKAPETPVEVDEEFENDPAFALYHNTPSTEDAEAPTETDSADMEAIDIFGGIQSEKLLARYELLDAEEEEQSATMAMVSVQRKLASLEAVCSRLEILTADL